MSATIESTVPEILKSFLSAPKKLLIGGQWVDAKSGKTFDVFDPATDQVVAKSAEGDAADVELAVAAARKAFDSGPWSTMTASQRGQIIWKIGDLIEQNADELAAMETIDNGKPLGVAKAADVALAADMFRYMAGWATKIEGNTIPLNVPYIPGGQFHAYTLKEPVGVVGQIIPWNFPLLMAAWKLGPALATGCTVVLKPAEQTPLSAIRLGELCQEAGIPDGVVNIITGFGETAGAAIAAHDDVDKVAFTGSTEVGKIIIKAAAGNLKKVTLELGGKSPNVVYDDADIDAAIAGAADAIFFNQGQVCSAGSRLFVQSGIYDEVVAGVSEIANNMKVGSGFDTATQMGPLVSREQFDRVSGYLQAGLEAGAEASAGGSAIDQPGYFVQPTVLKNASPEMSVVQEEIFDPSWRRCRSRTTPRLLAKPTTPTYGLAAGIWDSRHFKGSQIGKASQSRDRVGELLQHLRRRLALRRLQAIRLGQRDGPRGTGELSADKISMR